MQDDLRNQVADLCHRIWTEWWLYQRNCTTSRGVTQRGDITVTLPAEKVSRWQRQATTDYWDLPEHERKSDLEIADRYISLIKKLLEE